MINTDPYRRRLARQAEARPGAALDHLLTKAKYDAQLAAEGH